MELKVEYVFTCVVACFVLYSFIKQHIQDQGNDLKKMNKRLDEVEYKAHSIAYELGLKSLPPADLSVNYIRE